MAEKKQAVLSLLTLLFPKQNVFLTPRSIMISGEPTCTIDENNFEVLQDICKEIFCVNNSAS
jgi:hypothetical protein